MLRMAELEKDQLGDPRGGFQDLRRVFEEVSAVAAAARSAGSARGIGAGAECERSDCRRRASPAAARLQHRI